MSEHSFDPSKSRRRSVEDSVAEIRAGHRPLSREQSTLHLGPHSVGASCAILPMGLCQPSAVLERRDSLLENQNAAGTVHVLLKYVHETKA